MLLLGDALYLTIHKFLWMPQMCVQVSQQSHLSGFLKPKGLLPDYALKNADHDVYLLYQHRQFQTRPRPLRSWLLQSRSQLPPPSLRSTNPLQQLHSQSKRPLPCRWNSWPTFWSPYRTIHRQTMPNGWNLSGKALSPRRLS